jgi:hypothetical protein
LRGGGVYFAWGYGSWLDSDIGELFSISKDIGKGIEYSEEER